MDERPDGEPEGGSEPPHEEGPTMPVWVPAAIGVVLVIMAALAVYTGLRYRNPSLAGGIIHSRRPARTTGGGPPGEPGPGESLVYPSDSSDNAPIPNAPVAGRARAEIHGGGANGVVGTMRLNARRAMTISVVPDDALILINETPIGPANQLAGPYEFPQPGSYTVRITAPGYKDRQFIVTASDSSTVEVATVKATLEKQ